MLWGHHVRFLSTAVTACRTRLLSLGCRSVTHVDSSWSPVGGIVGPAGLSRLPFPCSGNPLWPGAGVRVLFPLFLSLHRHPRSPRPAGCWCSPSGARLAMQPFVHCFRSPGRGGGRWLGHCTQPRESGPHTSYDRAVVMQVGNPLLAAHCSSLAAFRVLFHYLCFSTIF